MLDRPSAWPRFQSLRDPGALKSEIEAFLKEQGRPEGMMPPAAALAEANRHDLLNAINKAGEGSSCKDFDRRGHIPVYFDAGQIGAHSQHFRLSLAGSSAYITIARVLSGALPLEGRVLFGDSQHVPNSLIR